MCPPVSCGCASVLLSLSGTPFCPLSSANPPKRTAPASTLGLLACTPGTVGWSVLAAQQPKSSKTDLVSFVCLAVLRALPLVVRFWPLSSPNPPKRTSPAWSGWLCSLLSLWWSVLAAQQPKSSNTHLATLVCLAASSGGPFWPLSSPNRPKRTSPAWSAWLGSLLCSGGPFWPLSSPNLPQRTSPAWSVVCLAVLPDLPLVVRFGRLKREAA